MAPSRTRNATLRAVTTPKFESIDIPVAWGDMDSFGHVNNVVYLRWFETGRMAFFAAVGVSTRDVAQGCGPILARTTCNFQRPLEHPDTVTVQTSISRVGSKSFTMSYVVRSQRLDEVAAHGDGVIVWFDYAAGASAAVPAELAARLRSYCNAD